MIYTLLSKYYTIMKKWEKLEELEQSENLKNLENQEESIITFLALFNQIDKQLDKILWEDKFLPYNEKIKRVIHEPSYISWFVKLHQYQLKYLWEIRNQITHGIKLNGHTYVMPTTYAIQQLKRYATAIKEPPQCKEIFGKEVFCVNGNSTLGEVIHDIKKKKYSHIPVYDDNHHFLGILHLNELLIWIFEQSKILSENTSIQEWKQQKIKNLQLFTDHNHLLFVEEKKNIYEIDEIFTKRKMKNTDLSVVLITKNWLPNEDLLGIITPSDVAIIDSFVMQ